MAPPSPAHQDALEVVSTRDAINTLFREAYHEPLLEVLEERSILDLIESCGDREQFSYRVNSLAGLATALNEQFLFRVTRVKPSDPGSLNLLEAFLQQELGPGRETDCIRTLRNINRVRQMYPVHTDRARGVRTALRDLGIDYPVNDFEVAWARILRAYLDALKDLRSMVGELVGRKATRSTRRAPP
jgi:hypothetical protein